MLEKLGKILTSAWAALVVSILLTLLLVSKPSLLQIIELKSFDYLIKTLPQKESKEIVIVEFGEKSVEKYGQWPFDRRDIAKTIQKLVDNNSGPIVIPILFSEKDRAGGDDELAKKIKETDGVILTQVPTTQNSKPDAVRRGFAAIGPTDPKSFAFSWPGGLRPLDIFVSNASGVGVAATVPEIDGSVRRIPLLSSIAGNLYPSIPLEVIRVLTQNKSYQIKTSEAGIEAVRVPRVPPVITDANGRMWLSWNTKFERMDATEIDNRVNGKIVILGLSIEGVGGVIATPNGEKWSHDIQAQALQTVLDGTTIQQPGYSNIIEILILSAFLIILLILVSRTSVFWTVPVLALFIASILYGSIYLFNNHLQLYNPTYIIIAGFIVFCQLVFNNFAREFRLKQQIKKQFGTYLSPAMVEKLQKNPDLLKLGGDTRELSIMFTDVRGFTAISEHYGDNVQGLTQIMNRYMTAMTQKILENEGTLDKYIGDAQMAFWNAPLDDKGHARNAVKTALAMLDDLDSFNKEIASDGVPPFGMGIGINTGSVVVGNMGSTQRFDYTCLGDAVNLASRLEGQSKNYGVKLIIGEETAKQLNGEYHTIKLDTIAVKGKKIGVSIYTIIPKDYIDPIYMTMHKEFMKDYRRGDWDTSLVYVSTMKKDKVFNGFLKEYYEMMEERILEYKANPPKDWDGTYHATSK